MKTNHSVLLPHLIRTKSLNVTWYKNDQMCWYEEMKDGRPHGDSKGWWRDGPMRRHYVYENGELIKRIA